MARREIEGEWIQGWPERRRSQTLSRKDEQGRLVHQRTPYWEQQGPLTPTDMRYLVAQLQTPDPADPAEWSLNVGGLVQRSLRLTLDDLQALPGHTVRMVHECSGSDAQFFEPYEYEQPTRYDLSKPHTGAASAGEFTGVSLATLLAEVGVHPTATALLAGGFDRGTPGEWAAGGARAVPEEINYEKALPLAKALHPDTMLAWGLNGEYLRHVHGGPLRLIVPGWSGNWSVKWLERLELLREMPHLYYQDEYFFYAESINDEQRVPITSMGVRCVITDPIDGDDALPAGKVSIHGLAWSGEGAITAVEVSVDGENWDPAELVALTDRWLWRRWTYRRDLPAGTYTVMARATDEAGRTQPQTPWNMLRKNYDGIWPMTVRVE